MGSRTILAENSYLPGKHKVDPVDPCDLVLSILDRRLWCFLCSIEGQGKWRNFPYKIRLILLLCKTWGLGEMSSWCTPTFMRITDFAEPIPLTLIQELIFLFGVVPVLHRTLVILPDIPVCQIWSLLISFPWILSQKHWTQAVFKRSGRGSPCILSRNSQSHCVVTHLP